MKRVLVTGGTGFIGRHCLAPLGARGFEVHGVSSRREGEENGARWHLIDLNSSPDVRRLLEELRPTHLLHLAWVTEPGKFWQSPENYRWVQASLGLFDAFVANGGIRAVVAGTCAEYDWSHGRCREGVTPCVPATPYGIAKLALSQLLQAYAAQSGISLGWGRIFFPFGPGEHAGKLTPSVLTSLLRGSPARCTHGEQIRDFLYVEDVADAFVAFLESDVQGPLNIASGVPLSIREFVSKVAAVAGHSDLVQFGALAAPPGDPPLLVADVARLHDELGWRPSRSLEEGIERTVAWWSSELERMPGGPMVPSVTSRG